MIKQLNRIGREMFRFKKELPESVYKGYVEANGKYPQTGAGILLVVLHKISQEKNFDYYNARKYGFSARQSSGLRKKMELLHKSIGIKPPLWARIFIRFNLKIVTLDVLNDVILAGVEDYFRHDENPSLEEFKIFTENLHSVLNNPGVIQEAKNRWQQMKNGNRSTVHNLDEIVYDLIYKTLTVREKIIFDKYFSSKF